MGFAVCWVTEIFGLAWEEVTGDWRKLHNRGLNDFHCSLACVIRVIESRIMGLARLVA